MDSVLPKGDSNAIFLSAILSETEATVCERRSIRINRLLYSCGTKQIRRNIRGIRELLFQSSLIFSPSIFMKWVWRRVRYKIFDNIFCYLYSFRILLLYIYFLAFSIPPKCFSPSSKCTHLPFPIKFYRQALAPKDFLHKSENTMWYPIFVYQRKHHFQISSSFFIKISCWIKITNVINLIDVTLFYNCFKLCTSVLIFYIKHVILINFSKKMDYTNGL